MNLSEIASCISAFVAIAIFWHNVRDKRFTDLKDSIKEVKDEIKDLRGEFKEIRVEIVDIRERLMALEVATIFINIKSDSGDTPNSRSEAMKKVWSKRNADRLEKKGE